MKIKYLLLFLILLLFGCASKTKLVPLGQASFESYRLDTQEYLKNNRVFVTENQAFELANNSPREWRPKGKPKKGILLVHGLGDSPWSFTDLGPALAKNGFLVRAILLPGCGSNPADMIEVSLEDWRKVVAQQADILGTLVDELYLGGFSNGASLALEYAYKNPQVKGLLLLSPAIKSKVGVDFLAPLAAVFKDWIMVPRSGQPEKDAFRYRIVPTNAFAQFYYLSVSVRRLLRDQPFDRPVVMVLSESDSVLDVPFIVKAFEEDFTNPASRLIYYGKSEKNLPDRSYYRTDYIPEFRISSFSHMGAMFSPTNEYYGFNGKEPMCDNGQSDRAQKRCQAGDEIWYSAWGLWKPGKIHARLTFNPYFDWQFQIIMEVLSPSRKAPNKGALTN
ncbi:MAG: alpha/beta fold hydrolase [Deltaproteobacteria bacterium]|jgi:esterase/lipase|nr:alpha/beta fold hydrolase [Deltaproteobacteria bacterium]